MPTILTHPAVPLAIGLGLGTRIVSTRLLVLGVVACAVPDLDVIAFRFGIAYSDQFGHRGATHSLMFAVVMASFAALMAPQLLATRRTAFLFILVATASHGLLDMLTTGGLGIALFWPFSDARLFFPAQVIQVSPISIRRFLDHRGIVVLLSEMLWVWLPSIVACLALYRLRRKNAL